MVDKFSFLKKDFVFETIMLKEGKYLNLKDFPLNNYGDFLSLLKVWFQAFFFHCRMARIRHGLCHWVETQKVREGHKWWCHFFWYWGALKKSFHKMVKDTKRDILCIGKGATKLTRTGKGNISQLSWHSPRALWYTKHNGLRCTPWAMENFYKNMESFFILDLSLMTSVLYFGTFWFWQFYKLVFDLTSYFGKYPEIFYFVWLLY